MRFRKLYRDERGMSLVFVGLGFMGFFAATMLAIDVGMLMTARNQAQNSADAGALGGAIALAFEDYDNRTPTGPAVTSAIRQATANKVMYANVSVTPSDVTFPQDPVTGQYNRVRVTVYRNGARGNPLSTIIAGLFGRSTADISAVATAEIVPAPIPARCFPFTIPDMWRELTDPPFISSSSTFEEFDGHGNLMTPHDVYVPATDQENYTGYRVPRNLGDEVILKQGSPATTVSPSEYNPITIPGRGTGAAVYRQNIIDGPCGNYLPGMMMVPEPGGMVGPTKQGVDEVIDQTSDVYYDADCRCVKSSTNNYAHINMRVGGIPLYDPDFYSKGKREGRFADFKVANYLGVFLERMDGNYVVARIVNIAGVGVSGAGNVPINSLPKHIRLIE